MGCNGARVRLVTTQWFLLTGEGRELGVPANCMWCNLSFIIHPPYVTMQLCVCWLEGERGGAEVQEENKGV